MATMAPPQRIQTLSYDGPVPYPHNAVTAPTPDEQYDEYVRTTASQEKAKDEALQAEQKASEGSSAMGKFSMFAKGIAHNVSKGANSLHTAVEAKVRNEVKEKEKVKFHTAFPEQIGAQFVCSYACKVMHAGQLMGGDLMISSTHINFKNTRLSESIPWANVLSIQRSIALPTINQGPPFILPVPADHVIPSCIQVFTTTRQLFQFLDFSNTAVTATSHMTTSIHGTAFERCYNFMDHTWRASGPVPVPNAQYLPQP